MERRAFIVQLTAAALAAPLAADAQQAEKVRRIGVLYSGSPPFVSHVTEAFRQGLSERGYVEGRNIAVEYRYAEERYERLPELAAEGARRSVSKMVGDHCRAVDRRIVPDLVAAFTLPLQHAPEREVFG